MAQPDVKEPDSAASTSGGAGERANTEPGAKPAKGAKAVKASSAKDAEAKVPDAQTVFASKITTRVKVLLGAAFIAVFLFSFFSGIYSMAQGHSLGQMLHAVGEHFNAYFWLWGQFFAHPGISIDPSAHGAEVNAFDNFINALTGTFTSDFTSDPKLDLALFNIRLPRIVLVLLVGAALSVAGGSFQGMFKNPLVSPDLLGASAGASLGACLAMLNDMPNVMVQFGAFVGGLAAVGLTVWMRRMIRSDAILGLVLAGMLVSTLFQSGMSFVKLVADTNDKLPSITYWLMGSFHSATKGDFWLAILPMVVGFILIFRQRWNLNVLSFGDDEARTMGVNTTRTRLIVILGATLVTSTSVAVAGIIGWIGLVIPHFARAVVGPNYKVLLPACLVMGSAYLLVIDDIARMLMSVEIPIGILTAILGVPFFLVIFRKTSRGW